MDKININGDFYDEEKVIFKGKQSYKKRDRVLRIVGGILTGLGVLMIIYVLFSNNPEYQTPTMYAMLAGMAIAGIVLLVISFMPKDYLKAGIRMIEAEIAKKDNAPKKKESTEAKPVVKPVVPKQIVKPDRVIRIDDKFKTRVQLKTDELLFNFVQGEKQTKVYTPEDIVGCEIIVDDEVVFNSTNKRSNTNSSFKGKEIGEGISGIGSVISKFGGTAKVVGTAATAAGTAIKGANIERNETSQSVEERRGVVHKYTFIVRLNDLNFPSFVARDISLEEMEDLGNTFAILLQHNQQAESVVRSRTEVPPEVIDVPAEETKEIPQEEEPKAIEQKQSSFDKFEEIKKYKELESSLKKSLTLKRKNFFDWISIMNKGDYYENI